MVKGKTIKKEKKVSKQKVSLPSKVKKGQITKKELKSVGFITPDNKLKSSAPVESISGVGIKKGSMLRAGGIENVGEYKKGFRDFILEQRAKKPKPKPIKPKPKPMKPKPKPIKPKPKPIKPKPKAKYYIIDNKTGKALSIASDSRKAAEILQKLFKPPSTVIRSKPENLERMGLSIKKRHAEVEKPKIVSESPFLDKRVLEIDELVKVNDYGKNKEFATSESVFTSTINNLENQNMELASIERDMSAFRDTEPNRKALARLNKVQKLTKESIAEWKLEKKQFIGEEVEVKPVKKVIAPRKGNEYIQGELNMEWVSKPKLKDWLNEEGKVRKQDLRKHVIAVYEAEYGKGSSEAEAIKEGTKYATGKRLYTILQSWMKTATKEKDKEVIFRHE